MESSELSLSKSMFGAAKICFTNPKGVSCRLPPLPCELLVLAMLLPPERPPWADMRRGRW